MDANLEERTNQPEGTVKPHQKLACSDEPRAAPGMGAAGPLGCCLLILLILSLAIVCTAKGGGPDLRIVARLYRGPFVVSLFLVHAGLSLIVWRHYNLNHATIFELDGQSARLPANYLLNLGSMLGIIWCISLILFVHSEPIGIHASLCPLALLSIMFFYLFNPIQAIRQREAHFWLLRVLGRILSAPFNSVRFADYWLADQFVSMVPLFLDLEYLICFYVSNDDALSTAHLRGPGCIDRCVSRSQRDLLIRTVVAILPAWLRVCQCVRISRDQNWHPFQLFNALKYASMMVVIVMSGLAQVGAKPFQLDGMKCIWIVCSTLVSCVAATWDMIYDFGVFESTFIQRTELMGSYPGQEARIRRWPFLRKQLTYPVWFYYFAILEDWALKFGWLIFILLAHVCSIDAELAITITTLTDLFSKFIWNVIKLENECRLNGLTKTTAVARLEDGNQSKIICEPQQIA